MMTTSPSPRRGEAGFSAIEAILILALLATTTLGITESILSSQQGLRHIEDDSVLFDQAQTVMNRLSAISFGTGSEGAADPWDLVNLITVENNLRGSANSHGIMSSPGLIQSLFTGSNATLTQLAPISPMEWEYSVNGDTYFGPPGRWSLVVDRDLNGDGDLLDPMEVATAGSADLFRIEIRFEGRRILKTIRSRNPSE